MNALFSITSVSRVEFLKSAAAYFMRRADETFTAAQRLETLNLNEFNAAKTAGATIFTSLEEVARRLGFQPDGSFGSLTRIAHLDQQDAHKIGCACNGEEVTGEEVASRIERRLTELR